jgi:hypothetical protein
VSMASKYHLKLWDRDAGNGLVVPMVMLNINQVDKVLSETDDVLIEESRIMESRDELALKPSPLNEGLNETLHFNESGIKKTRNGDYMVWATPEWGGLARQGKSRRKWVSDTYG